MGKAIDALRERMATHYDLTKTASLLNWDQLTIMPIRGGSARAHQIKTIEVLAHQMLIDAETGRLLEAADSEIAADGALEVDAALVRVTRRDFDRARRVPGVLVGEIAKAAADGYAIWTEARANNDFASFLPALERNIELQLRFVDCFEVAESPYDVLAETYEHGLTSAEITTIFEELKPFLRPLVDRVVARGEHVKDDRYRGSFPIERQEELGLWVLGRIGFEPLSWRLDPTVHPFQSSMSIQDIRLTTRYNETDPFDALLSTVHEFGHGIYENQIDPDLERTPLAGGCSMTLHESQSRFWENMIGRSREFAELIHPAMERIFPEQMAHSTPHELHKATNVMRPSLIRVEADELTYGFHIIVRYELEREIVENGMNARDLPEAWNSKMKEYLGIDVPNDRLGVLQDVHWSAGSIGYFPTYFLGSILAAQIWKRMVADLPDARDLIRNGDFAPIRAWQRQHIHGYGRMYTPKETIVRAVGGPLDPEPYIAYMTTKVNSLYGTAS
ncbi:MAG: carboxypeptidase M32 [Thermomicrobiales bacterium]